MWVWVCVGVEYVGLKTEMGDRLSITKDKMKKTRTYVCEHRGVMKPCMRRRFSLADDAPTTPGLILPRVV